jgi:putative glycosyltransferase
MMTGLAHAFRFLSILDLPENVIVAHLMTRRYVDPLLRHEGRETLIARLWVITGFAQSPQRPQAQPGPFHLHATPENRTVCGFRGTVQQRPVERHFFLGCCISLLSCGYITWQFLVTPHSGSTSALASVWLLGGLTIAFIGLIGIYLSKIYSEAKRRPYTIDRQDYGAEAEK